MENNRFSRQLDLCPPQKLASPITVIGAGAVGAASTVTLATMGCNGITVFRDNRLIPGHLQGSLTSCQHLTMMELGRRRRGS